MQNIKATDTKIEIILRKGIMEKKDIAIEKITINYQERQT